jgi:NTP pyrophosphatase (non-canonical NTP hydrolase)
MDLDAFQKSAKRTLNPSLDDRDRLLDAAAGLSEEAAEVLGLVRKRVFQNREIPREKLVEELGDALWCLAITADALDIPLNEVGSANLEKLAQRHPEGYTQPRGPEGWSRSPKE